MKGIVILLCEIQTSGNRTTTPGPTEATDVVLRRLNVEAGARPRVGDRARPTTPTAGLGPPIPGFSTLFFISTFILFYFSTFLLFCFSTSLFINSEFGGPNPTFQLLCFIPGWQKLCGGKGGPRRKVWTRTKILSPNICYFAAN